MIHFEARVPGKLVLLGEYAVLEGVPALGVAVDRQVTLTWTENISGQQTIELIPIHNGTIESPFQRGSQTVECRAPLALIEAVFNAFAPDHLAGGFGLTIDSSALFDQAGHKFGLGSSAAAAVGLAGLSNALVGGHHSLGEIHSTLCSMHQAGGGSGLDLAIALAGGLIEYQRPTSADEAAHWRALSWPRALSGLMVFTHQPASTPDFIASYQAWKTSDSGAWKKSLQSLESCVSQTMRALSQSDWGEFLAGFTEYGVRMGTMGGSMGREVVTAVHHQLRALGEGIGVGYKPCGAGGGDVGLFLTDDPDKLEGLVGRVMALGCQSMPLAVALEGLIIEQH